MKNWTNNFKKKTPKSEQADLERPSDSADSILSKDWVAESDYIENYDPTEDGYSFPRHDDNSGDKGISLDDLRYINQNHEKQLLSDAQINPENRPLCEDSVSFGKNFLDAKFTEYKKPVYMAQAGGIILVISLAAFYFTHNLVISLIGFLITALLLLLALIAYFISAVVKISLDENRKAILLVKGLFTATSPTAITDYDVFIYNHENKYFQTMFLHLDVKLENGKFLSFSGRCEPDQKVCATKQSYSGTTEDLQATGGAFVIEKMAKLLDKASGCKRYK